MRSTRLSSRRQPPDLYSVLDVSADANLRVIEASYWALVRSGPSQDEMVLLNKAYEVLTNSTLREEYDATRTTAHIERAATEERKSKVRATLPQPKMWPATPARAESQQADRTQASLASVRESLRATAGFDHQRTF